MKPGIEIRGIRMNLNVGWTEIERKTKQPINLDLVLRFEATPKACFTDKLEDTVCYATIVSAVRDKCLNNSYRLLEKLAYEIHAEVRKHLDNGAHVGVRVTKVTPPINEVNSVSFLYGEVNTW